MHLGYTLFQELGRSVQVSWVNLVPFSGMMLVRSYLEFLQIFLQDFYKLSCQDLTRCIDRVTADYENLADSQHNCTKEHSNVAIW